MIFTYETKFLSPRVKMDFRWL